MEVGIYQIEPTETAPTKRHIVYDTELDKLFMREGEYNKKIPSILNDSAFDVQFEKLKDVVSLANKYSIIKRKVIYVTKTQMVKYDSHDDVVIVDREDKDNFIGYILDGKYVYAYTKNIDSEDYSNHYEHSSMPYGIFVPENMIMNEIGDTTSKEYGEIGIYYDNGSHLLIKNNNAPFFNTIETIPYAKNYSLENMEFINSL